MADKTIFVVDDEQDNLDFLEAILAETDYTVETFLSGTAALARMAQAKPDLVFLDVQMPGMNGFQVLKAMRDSEELAGTPAVFLSAIGAVTGIDYDAKTVSEQYGVEAQSFIAKPIDPGKVIATVEVLLGA